MEGKYGRCASNPAEPKSDLAWLVLRDSSGEFDTEVLEQYIRMQKFTDRRFDINEKDAEIGFTALHWAVSYGNIEGVKILIEYGANIHVKDVLGFTPLFYCTSQSPNLEMTAYLVEKCKAKVDERSASGGTCLHGAALKGNTEIVKYLLKHGADPRACNEEGTTPFDLGRGYQAVLDLLHRANSKSDSSRDKEGTLCANCGKTGKLKRCARCQVTYYCSKECQKRHWKEGNHKATCEEGIIAEPGRFSGYQVTVMNVLGARKPTVALFGGETGEYLASKDYPTTKRFVVKVQRPLPPFFGDQQSKDLMVYNVDRSVDLFIREETPGYGKIVKKILNEGIMGLKGYFWAECVPGEGNLVKVFPGKLAPTQEW